MSGPSEEKVRKAIDSITRDRIEHARRTGQSDNARSHEKAAQEIARRNEDRRNGRR